MEKIISVDFGNVWKDILHLNDLDRQIFENALSWINGRLVFINMAPKIIDITNDRELISMSTFKFEIRMKEVKIGLWQITGLSFVFPDEADPNDLDGFQKELNLLKEQVQQCNGLLRKAFLEEEKTK